VNPPPDGTWELDPAATGLPPGAVGVLAIVVYALPDGQFAGALETRLPEGDPLFLRLLELAHLTAEESARELAAHPEVAP